MAIRLTLSGEQAEIDEALATIGTVLQLVGTSGARRNRTDPGVRVYTTVLGPLRAAPAADPVNATAGDHHHGPAHPAIRALPDAEPG